MPHTILVHWDNDKDTTGWTNVTAPNEEGNHSLSIKISDQAGWWANKTFWWIIDNTPPLLFTDPAVAYLTMKPWCNGTKINATTEDGIIKYNWDQGENVSSDYPRRNQVMITIGMPDGSHQITLYAIDQAGNINTTMIQIIVDSTPIDIALTYPKNEETKDYTIWATVIFSERPYNFTAHWAGENAKTYWKSNTLKVKCVKIEGTHDLTITAYDEAGNFSTASIKINMMEDPLPIFLAIVGIIGAIIGSVGGGSLLILVRRQRLLSANGEPNQELSPTSNDT
ncbi:MAG: hypothetical protein ACE5OZ_03535 [Candidatus Heimdallarchaeota archaeon]